MKRLRSALTLVLACLLSPVPVLAGESAVTHRVLVQGKGRIAIVDRQGRIEWEAPCNFVTHDGALLPNGNVLFSTNSTTTVEMTPDKKIVWQYVSLPKEGYAGKVEVHAFQRLANGRTMIAESGNQRIIEVDRDGSIVHQVPLTIHKPNAHRDTRRARKLDNGNDLVCHEADGTVREYEPTGKVVWSYTLDLAGRERTPGHAGHGTEVFNALRLPNGNTLIGAGNGNRVIEVDKAGRTVWSVEQAELPGIKLFWVTSLQRLPNGNTIIGNTHAGPDNPQIIEVTRDKKVVWTFKDFDTFGNDVCIAQVLDVPGNSVH